MNIENIDDVFKNSYVLNMDDRRYYMLCNRLLRQHIYVAPRKMRGCSIRKSSSTNFWGRMLDEANKSLIKVISTTIGHFVIIQAAKALDLPYVLIFEDDAVPIDGMAQKLAERLAAAPEDANILYLGWVRYYPVNIEGTYTANPYWRRLSKNPGSFSGSHAYIVFNKAYDKWIDAFNTQEFVSDRTQFFVDNSYISDINLFAQYSAPGVIKDYNSPDDVKTLSVKYPMPDAHKYFVKILIPAYNAEKYLHRTMQTILAQSFKDFAVVICDDRSEDGTYEIARQYASENENVFVCRSKHGKNASAARNTALDFGIDAEYTWFVDADDFIYGSDALQIIHDKINGKGLDAVLVNGNMYNNDWASATRYNSVCFKIVKTSKVVRFNEELDIGHEDVLHNAQQMNALDADKIAYIDRKLYQITGGHHFSPLPDRYKNIILNELQNIDVKNEIARKIIQSRTQQIKKELGIK